MPGGGGEAWQAEFPEAAPAEGAGAGPGAGWGDWQGGGGYAPLAAGEGAWETFDEAEVSAAGPAVRPKETFDEAEARRRQRRQRPEWRALAGDADVWDSPARASLATQARAGARVAALSVERPGGSVLVQIAEDGYKGYLAERDWEAAEPSALPAGAADAEAEAAGPELRQRAVRFALEAEGNSNAYKWGGTLGPDFDCSGLVQSAFASQGLVLPRDAYQQCTFAGVEPVAASELQPGDLIFFGPGPPNSREGALRTNHVALCVRGATDGEDGEAGTPPEYVHSSGREHGRNGIGRDFLGENRGAVSDHYFRLFQAGGRCGRPVRGLSAGGPAPWQKGFAAEVPGEKEKGPPPLSEAEVVAIKRAMGEVRFDYVPQWAKNDTEELWLKRAIAQRPGSRTSR